LSARKYIMYLEYRVCSGAHLLFIRYTVCVLAHTYYSSGTRRVLARTLVAACPYSRLRSRSSPKRASVTGKAPPIFWVMGSPQYESNAAQGEQKYRGCRPEQVIRPEGFSLCRGRYRSTCTHPRFASHLWCTVLCRRLENCRVGGSLPPAMWPTPCIPCGRFLGVFLGISRPLGPRVGARPTNFSTNRWPNREKVDAYVDEARLGIHQADTLMRIPSAAARAL
jgi:hypothetical protein